VKGRKVIKLQEIKVAYSLKNHCVKCYTIHQWLYSPLFCPGLYFSFVIFFTQTLEFLGRVISPSQGRYLHTGQQKHRINAHTDMHALSRIRTHDPSARAGEDRLRPRGHRVRLKWYYLLHIQCNITMLSFFELFQNNLRSAVLKRRFYLCRSSKYEPRNVALAVALC
jgi:hypothetical protein